MIARRSVAQDVAVSRRRLETGQRPSSPFETIGHVLLGDLVHGFVLAHHDRLLLDRYGIFQKNVYETFDNIQLIQFVPQIRCQLSFDIPVQHQHVEIFVSGLSQIVQSNGDLPKLRNQTREAFHMQPLLHFFFACSN